MLFLLTDSRLHPRSCKKPQVLDLSNRAQQGLSTAIYHYDNGSRDHVSSPCGILSIISEEVVHASLSVTAMSRVQQNLLFSSTYLQPTGRGDGALQVLVAGLWQGL